MKSYAVKSEEYGAVRLRNGEMWGSLIDALECLEIYYPKGGAKVVVRDISDPYEFEWDEESRIVANAYKARKVLGDIQRRLLREYGRTGSPEVQGFLEDVESALDALDMY